MPRKAEITEEYGEMMEDEIAVMLEAKENIKDFEALTLLLYQKEAINLEVYDKYVYKLDRIRMALLLGKRNTATLRRMQ